MFIHLSQVVAEFNWPISMYCNTLYIDLHDYSLPLCFLLDVFGSILDLPDELTNFQDTGGLAEIGQLSNNTSIGDPPCNTGPTGNISLARVTGNTSVAAHVNSTQKSLAVNNNMTPPPNAVIITSGDPTPTLPSISSSPIHSSPATMVPGGNIGMYHNNNIGMNPNIHASGMNSHIDPRVMYNNQAHYNSVMGRNLRFHGPTSAPPPHPVSSIADFAVVRPQVQHNSSVYHQTLSNQQHMNFNPNLGLQNQQIHNRPIQGTDQLSQQQSVSQAGTMNQQVWNLCVCIQYMYCISAPYYTCKWTCKYC